MRNAVGQDHVGYKTWECLHANFHVNIRVSCTCCMEIIITLKSNNSNLSEITSLQSLKRLLYVKTFTNC